MNLHFKGLEGSFETVLVLSGRTGYGGRGGVRGAGGAGEKLAVCVVSHAAAALGLSPDDSWTNAPPVAEPGS